MDLVGYLSGMGIERRAIGLWFDALLKRALVPELRSERPGQPYFLSPKLNGLVASGEGWMSHFLYIRTSLFIEI